MNPWDLAYGTAMVGVLGARPFSPKLKASLEARKRFPPPELSPGPRAWIHGASVGEILASESVLKALRALKADAEAILSVNTPTGLEAAGRRFPDALRFAMPLDFSARISEAFDRVKPRLLVLMELEIWPNLLSEAQRRSVPVLCVNARMTERSFRRYRVFRILMGPSFRRVDLYLAQGDAHAERLVGMGVHPDRIRVLANLKSLASAPASRPDWIPDGASVLVAGSTHPGEEECLLEAFRHLPGWRLVLAPRHPERFEEVAALLQARGVPFERRSAPSGKPWTVLLLDTLGELRSAYAGAALAFVGGSLAPVGGHNVLEPALSGVPVLTGPHLRHVAEDAARLEAAGGLKIALDAGLLTSVARELASDPGRLAAMGEAARKGASADPGALLEALRPFAERL